MLSGLESIFGFTFLDAEPLFEQVAHYFVSLGKNVHDVSIVGSKVLVEGLCGGGQDARLR
jgi:hypothetical protein